MSNRFLQLLPLAFVFAAITIIAMGWRGSENDHRAFTQKELNIQAAHEIVILEGYVQEHVRLLLAAKAFVTSSTLISASEWNSFVKTMRVPEYFSHLHNLYLLDREDMQVEAVASLGSGQERLPRELLTKLNQQLVPEGTGVMAGAFTLEGQSYLYQAIAAQGPSSRYVVLGLYGKDEFFQSFFRHLGSEQLVVKLDTLDEDGYAIAQYSSAPTILSEEWLVPYEGEIKVLGFHWKATYTPTERFMLAHFRGGDTALVVVEILITLLVWYALHQLIRSRERIRRLGEKNYRRMLAVTSQGYWRLETSDFTIDEVNPALCKLLGYREHDLLHHSPLEFVDEAYHQQLKACFTQSFHGKEESLTVKMRARGGQLLTVQMGVNCLFDTEGKLEAVFSLFSDITELTRQEEQLRIAATFFETTTEAITVTDAQNRIVAVNPAFCSITGYTEMEALGQNPKLLNSGRHSEHFYQEMWDELQRKGRWQGEIWNRRKSGEIFPEWLSIVAIRDAQGEIVQYMAVFSDISKRKQDEEKIWYQANYDALTGLPNRNLMVDRLRVAMSQAHREKTDVALMFLDLDNFKVVNDSLGHSVGDELLQMAAERIQSCLREADTVARLGGDEFAIILTDMDNINRVEEVAERISEVMDQPFKLEHGDTYVTASTGIALYPKDTEDLSEMMRFADAALHRTKSLNGTTYHYYTQEMNADLVKRHRMGNELRKAMERNELEVYFQPIHNADGGVDGAEALLRWYHPSLGSVSPEEFIPLAEELGLVVPIEHWVISHACNAAKHWEKLAKRPIFVAVNISGVQCATDELLKVLDDSLQASGLSPQMLKLEITERMMMQDTEEVIELLNRVKAMGIRLSVDDFGTGYSSLSYLKRFPVDVLKVDKAFIQDLPEDTDSAALVTAIIVMAHSLNLQVVSEGVETYEQYQFLQLLGNDLYQGYHYAPAMDYSSFCTYLLDGDSGHKQLA